MKYSFAPSHSREPLRKALKCTFNLKKDVEEVSDEVTDQPCFHFHEFDISCLSKFVKIQKRYLHLLWFRFFAWSTHSPHHARESFRKALKCVVVMEKWLSKNWSSLEGETRWNLACVISLVLHIMLPESRSFIFSHSLSGVEIFCHKDSQQWKPIKFWLLRRTHCQGLSRHKLLATTKCPAAGHGLN